MEPYLFYGIVLPERAQLSLQLELKFSQPAYDSSIQAKVSIVLNQVAVWVETEHEWNIYDLRNAVGNIVQDHLAMIGYLTGRAYDLELTRVLNRSREIDHVFGIEISCLAKRGESIDFTAAMAKLRDKTSGQNGVFLRRCFGDLASSIKHPIDTGFYCYRAISPSAFTALHCMACPQLKSQNNGESFGKSLDATNKLSIPSRQRPIRSVMAGCLTPLPMNVKTCSILRGISSTNTSTASRPTVPRPQLPVATR